MCVGTLGLKTARRLKVPTEAQTQRERECTQRERERVYPERKNVPRERECTQRERESVPRERECTDTHSIIGVGTGGAGQAMA